MMYCMEYLTPLDDWGYEQVWKRLGEPWITREGAEWLAHKLARKEQFATRVVDQSGRVVSVYEPEEGKRLTFPIATAVAYAALAKLLARGFICDAKGD